MLRALRHRDFRLLWMGQAVSLIGDGIYLVAIAWLVYDISNEPGALAIVGLAWTLPMVLGLLLAGVLSDRFERRRLLVLSDLMRGAAIAALGAGAVWAVGAVARDRARSGLRLRRGAVPARLRVNRARRGAARAVAAPSTLREMMEPLGLRFAGPALGGVLIAVFGAGTALLVDAGTFAVSAVLVSLMARQPPPREETSSLRKDLVEGFS